MKLGIEVWTAEANGPVFYESPVTSYTKGPMFIIKIKEGVYDRYPLCNLYKIREITNGGSHVNTE